MENCFFIHLIFWARCDDAGRSDHHEGNRITELSVQSANGTNSDTDRQAIQKKISQIKQEIERIGDTTEFNTRKLFRDNPTTGSKRQIVIGNIIEE